MPALFGVVTEVKSLAFSKNAIPNQENLALSIAIADDQRLVDSFIIH